MGEDDRVVIMRTGLRVQRRRGGTGRRWLGQIGWGLGVERRVKKIVRIGIAMKERFMIRKGR